MTSSNTLLEIKHLTVVRQERTLLKDINLKLEKKSFTTLIGPNGAGKTTLLKTIIGQTKPTHGKVKFAPKTVLGYMPQKLELNQLMPLRVSDLLALCRRKTGCDHKELYDRLGINELMDKSIHRLSGGEFQRVLLTRALSRHPDLLILDEPTQGLDVTGQVAFYGYLDKIVKDLKIAVLMVSHDLHYVHRASSKVICLNKHICCQGLPKELEGNAHLLSLFPEFGQEKRAGEPLVKPYVHQHDHHHDDGFSIESLSSPQEVSDD